MKKYILLSVFLIILLSCKQTNSNDSESISPVDSTIHLLGEGALWDAENQRLLFIDIMGKKLFEYYPGSNKRIDHEMPLMIGTVVVKDKNNVLVALEDGIYNYNLDTRKLDFLICPPENDSTQRFNDGKCDPAGRFWVGTMSLIGEKETSHLFCLDSNGNMEVKLKNISTSNGIVWSSDKKYMYYIDTPTRKVMEYSYNNQTGEIGEARVAVQVADSLGFPDGMAIDKNDHLWVCMWGGASVCCFDRKSGLLLDRIKVPALNVTSCAFTGKDQDQLYITTASIWNSKEVRESFPLSGSLFKTSIKIR